jgi:hypothetical protein
VNCTGKNTTLCDTVTNNCTCGSCYPGYCLLKGECKVSNPLCESLTEDCKCKTCYGGYILQKGNCTVAWFLWNTKYFMY